MKQLITDGPWFKDQQGRVRLLRGVNLGGSSKVPYTPDGATHLAEGFFDHKNVSFVGRPFPLEEADQHFTRLKQWGFDFMRFLVTWEAIEHAGPGQYDEAYLDYVRAVVEKAREYDIQLFIDPHQDVWSRFSGGDGAPGWTFDLIGMDITAFKPTGAAIVHQTHGDPFPRMIWPSNYNKLAAATMFTLFFGGDDFAPRTTYEGMSVQEFLQSHYIRAMQQVAERLAGLDNVIGYDTLNEPSPGFIGDTDVRTIDHQLRIGDVPTPYQTMLLGAGLAQSIAVYELSWLGSRQVGTRVITCDGKRAYKDGYRCVWSENGVWDIDSKGLPRLLRPHHFGYKPDGSPVDFANDYLRPFVNRYAAAIREVDPKAVIFMEAEAVLRENPPIWGPGDADNIVYAPHWYDGVLLFTKRYVPFAGINAFTVKPVLGLENVRRSFRNQLKKHKDWARDHLGNVPVVIGEVGIPYDLNDRVGFRYNDFRVHGQAIERTMQALDANLLNFTWWNYTADNSNARGDQWNGEDISVFSRDQQTDPSDCNSGGRALNAVVRPYARAIPGTPLRMTFDQNSGVFTFAYKHDPKIDAPAELFIPNHQYPDGYRVEIEDGEYEVDRANQRLIYRHSDKDVPHLIRVVPLVTRETNRDHFWRNRLAIFGIFVTLALLLMFGRKRK